MDEDVALKLFEEDQMLMEKVSNTIKKAEEEMPGSEGEKWLIENRGLTKETIRKMQLGYDPGDGMIVIPYPGEPYCIKKTMTGNGTKRLSGNLDRPPFLIGEVDKGTLFVTTTELNAIYLWQMGAGNVFALCERDADRIRDIDKPHRVIFVKSGKGEDETLSRELDAILSGRGILHDSVTMPKGDPNRTPKEIMAEAISEWDKEIAGRDHSDNTAEFMAASFYDQLKRFRSYKDRKTGFWNMDEEMGALYPGLYVLGALPSLGKTTFCHQLADQLVAQGDTVLFFSFEQTMLEIVTKGISRLTAKMAVGDTPDIRSLRSNAVSSINVRRGVEPGSKWDKTVETATQEYRKMSERLYIIECNFETTADWVADYVKNFIREKKVTPVVMIDYLQIILPEDTRQSTKDAVDSHVRKMKMLQRDHDLVLFLISSLNRSNYLAPIDYESFKESGGVEYTADVVLGLQLDVMNAEAFRKSNETIIKREITKAAKKEVPRNIQISCLKNRFGKSSFTCGFDYYAEWDLFVPRAESSKYDIGADVKMLLEGLEKDTKKSRTKSSGVVQEAVEGFLAATEEDDVPFENTEEAQMELENFIP